MGDPLPQEKMGRAGCIVLLLTKCPPKPSGVAVPAEFGRIRRRHWTALCRWFTFPPRPWQSHLNPRHRYFRAQGEDCVTYFGWKDQKDEMEVQP